MSCNPNLALACLRKLARYVPHGAPNLDGEAAAPWLAVVTGYNPEDLFKSFAILKERSEFPSLESMRDVLEGVRSETDALDWAALNILGHMGRGDELTPWCQKLWNSRGGDNGWRDVPATDGSYRFIRAIVQAEVKISGMPPNRPVSERELGDTSMESLETIEHLREAI